MTGHSTASSGRSWPAPAARHPPGRGRRGRRARLRAACLVIEAAAGRRPTSRSSRRWLRRAADRPLRDRCAAQDLAHRRGRRRDDPHRRHGRIGRRGDSAGGTEPVTTATAQDDGSWVLSVPRPACRRPVADAILVPATCRAADGSSTGPASSLSSGALTASHSRGRRRRPEARGDRGARRCDRRCRPAGGRGADGAAVIECITEFATAALCVEEAGVCATALELTAEYTKTRCSSRSPSPPSSGRQRAADAYVDTEAIRLTAGRRRRGWRRPAASSEVAIAKYWAAEGGQRVVHAASHLHGASASTAITRCTASSSDGAD